MIEIKRLSPALLEDFLTFFDTTPHNTDKSEDRCYCVGWCSADCKGQDFSTAQKRRALAIDSVNSGRLQGYLAYRDGKAVGWCNANTKDDCYHCQYGEMYLGCTQTGDSPGAKVKSVFCFAVAPELRRQGVAGLLLEKVCEDAAREGFAFAEAYPNREFVSDLFDCMGPLSLYESAGFTVCYEIGPKLVMRKKLNA